MGKTYKMQKGKRKMHKQFISRKSKRPLEDLGLNGKNPIIRWVPIVCLSVSRFYKKNEEFLKCIGQLRAFKKSVMFWINYIGTKKTVRTPEISIVTADHSAGDLLRV
jgi:hypothetical protein